MSRSSLGDVRSICQWMSIVCALGCSSSPQQGTPALAGSPATVGASGPGVSAGTQAVGPAGSAAGQTAPVSAGGGGAAPVAAAGGGAGLPAGPDGPGTPIAQAGSGGAPAKGGGPAPTEG